MKNAELMTLVILKTTCKRVLPERQEAVVTQIGSKLSQRNAARNRKGNGGGTDSRCLEKRCEGERLLKRDENKSRQ